MLTTPIATWKKLQGGRQSTWKTFFVTYNEHILRIVGQMKDSTPIESFGFDAVNSSWSQSPIQFAVGATKIEVLAAARSNSAANLTYLIWTNLLDDTSDIPNYLSVFDDKSMTWCGVTSCPYPESSLEKSSLVELNNVVYLFRATELVTYDIALGSWNSHSCTGIAPSPRTGQSLTVIPESLRPEKYLLLFGGKAPSCECGYSNEVFMLETQTYRWRKITAGQTNPTPRANHSATFVGTHSLVIVGGESHVGWLNDVWLFDLASFRWMEVECRGVQPNPRCCHFTLECATSPQDLILYGGVSDLHFHDIYRLKLKNVDLLGTIIPVVNVCEAEPIQYENLAPRTAWQQTPHGGIGKHIQEGPGQQQLGPSQQLALYELMQEKLELQSALAAKDKVITSLESIIDSMRKQIKERDERIRELLTIDPNESLMEQIQSLTQRNQHLEVECQHLRTANNVSRLQTMDITEIVQVSPEGVRGVPAQENQQIPSNGNGLHPDALKTMRCVYSALSASEVGGYCKLRVFLKFIRAQDILRNEFCLDNVLDIVHAAQCQHRGKGKLSLILEEPVFVTCVIEVLRRVDPELEHAEHAIEIMSEMITGAFLPILDDQEKLIGEPDSILDDILCPNVIEIFSKHKSCLYDIFSAMATHDDATGISMTIDSLDTFLTKTGVVSTFISLNRVHSDEILNRVCQYGEDLLNFSQFFEVLARIAALSPSISATLTLAERLTFMFSQLHMNDVKKLLLSLRDNNNTLMEDNDDTDDNLLFRVYLYYGSENEGSYGFTLSAWLSFCEDCRIVCEQPLPPSTTGVVLPSTQTLQELYGLYQMHTLRYGVFVNELLTDLGHMMYPLVDDTKKLLLRGYIMPHAKRVERKYIEPRITEKEIHTLSKLLPCLNGQVSDIEDFSEVFSRVCLSRLSCLISLQEVKAHPHQYNLPAAYHSAIEESASRFPKHFALCFVLRLCYLIQPPPSSISEAVQILRLEPVVSYKAPKPSGGEGNENTMYSDGSVIVENTDLLTDTLKDIFMHYSSIGPNRSTSMYVDVLSRSNFHMFLKDCNIPDNTTFPAAAGDIIFNAVLGPKKAHTVNFETFCDILVKIAHQKFEKYTNSKAAQLRKLLTEYVLPNAHRRTSTPTATTPRGVANGGGQQHQPAPYNMLIVFHETLQMIYDHYAEKIPTLRSISEPVMSPQNFMKFALDWKLCPKITRQQVAGQRFRDSCASERDIQYATFSVFVAVLSQLLWDACADPQGDIPPEVIREKVLRLAELELKLHDKKFVGRRLGTAGCIL
eukprot:PhF_6_TR1064/c0_g1_i1/m.2236